MFNKRVKIIMAVLWIASTLILLHEGELSFMMTAFPIIFIGMGIIILFFNNYQKEEDP